MKKYLSIDVGGSSIKYGVFDETAKKLEGGSYSSPSSLEEMYLLITKTFQQYKEYHLEGLALSMPGAVDSDIGIIGGSSAYDYIHGPNIKKDLEEILNVTVEIENDANCAALAEVWKGAASDVEDCCFIVSGTGVGGAIVKDRRIHKGKHLHGGEFGYMIADFNFETKEMITWSDVSTVAVVKEVAALKEVDISTLNGKDIFDNYHDDPIYEKVVDKYYTVLANGIYNLQYVCDPQKIIIGGAISSREDILEEINKRLDIIFQQFTHAKIRPNVLVCQYYNDANLVGALYHYISKHS